VLARHDRLGVLLNNAGLISPRYAESGGGYELTIAVNHLAPFLLTNLLLDLLERSAPARVVTVASIGHRRATLDLDDLSFERGYAIMRAYGRSKLANVLFSAELARRCAGAGVTSNSLHPGAVATNIWSGAPLWAKPLILVAMRPFFLSVKQGAKTLVQLAADPALEGVTGKYFEEGREIAPAPQGQDAALARRLWEVSAGMVGLPAETARVAQGGAAAPA